MKGEGFAPSSALPVNIVFMDMNMDGHEHTWEMKDGKKVCTSCGMEEEADMKGDAM